MLVLSCPDWPVVAAGHPARDPVAVVRANRVVACSEAARVDGVAVGLRRRAAQARCPDLVVVEHDPGLAARAFEPVMAILATFTPRVEVLAPGTAGCATRGPSRYFGGDRALAAKVAAAVDAHLATLGAPSCRVGVADGRFAAELAARSAPAPSPTVVVGAGASAGFLAPMPVSVLGRPELADLLVRLGLPTLGDLAALPASAALARFGSSGLEAHRLAQGRDERPLEARTPPPDLMVTAEIDPPADRMDQVAFVAKALADELHDRLAGRGLACTQLAIEAETEHGEHQVRLWRHDGALRAAAIAERVRWQLDGWLSSITAGITLLRLAPEEVAPDHGRQLGFWGASAAVDDRAARGLARIQGLLGPDAVVTAVLGGGRDPAEQIRLVPWGDPREPARPGAAAGPRGKTGGPGGTTPPRPASCPSRRTMGAAAGEVPPWPGRLPAPAPAEVHLRPVAVVVRDAQGAPVSVSARGEISAAPVDVVPLAGPPRRVCAWTGPWPAEERWWDAGSARRRARLQLVLDDGSASLVVLEAGQWWVEAVYD